jgi:hypothetical protein
MGRLLIFLGIIALVVGIGGNVLRGVGSLSNIIPNIGNMLPSAEGLCKTGETLETDTSGVSQYKPGQGYAQNVRLYCVNAAGDRREVTGDYANSMMGQVSGIFGNVFGAIGSSFVWTGLTIGGVVLIVVGGILNGRGRRRQQIVLGGLSAVEVIRVGNQTIQVSPDSNRVQTQAGQVGADALTVRLKQLEQALQAGLISQEEFDRVRQQILDSLKG